MRLINADKARDTATIDLVVHHLDRQPTIDAVPVVRCKDCKYWGGVVFGNVCRRWSAPLAGMRNDTKPDDFCSYGERKDGDGNG